MHVNAPAVALSLSSPAKRCRASLTSTGAWRTPTSPLVSVLQQTASGSTSSDARDSSGATARLGRARGMSCPPKIPEP